MTTAIQSAWEVVPTAPELNDQAKQFVLEINAKREAGIAAGKTEAESRLLMANTLRECGILLDSAKAALSDSQWKLAQSHFAFSEQQIAKATFVARRCPEPITDLQLALRLLCDVQLALGFAEFEGHGPQKLHPVNPAAVFVRHLTTFRSDLKTLAERAPIAEWSSTYAQQTYQMAEPLLKDIMAMTEQIKSKATQK